MDNSRRSSHRAAVIYVMALLVTFVPVSLGARQDFDQLVVFGTSISDPGNAFALVGGNNTPPAYDLDPFLIPSTTYPKGGHHATNGATWIEQFARELGLSADVQAAFRSPGAAAMNFAVATARARVFPNNAHLALQVGTYLLKTGGGASPDTLYVFEIGSSDVRDAFEAALTGSGNPATIRQQAIDSISAAITVLHSRGARQFLVWNAPDLGLTPAVLRLGQTVPFAPELATQQAALFNADLATRIALLSGLPGIDIEEFDIFGLLQDVVDNKAQYGFDVVNAACVTPNDPPFTCQTPETYLFWDGLHPTKAGHAIIADEVRALLGL